MEGDVYLQHNTIHTLYCTKHNQVYHDFILVPTSAYTCSTLWIFLIKVYYVGEYGRVSCLVSKQIFEIQWIPVNRDSVKGDFQLIGI